MRWYAMEWMAEADGIDRLHEPHPGPGDRLGAPEWSPRFKSYLLAPADSIDEAGYYTKPLHAALFAVAKDNAAHYRLLTRLRETWDPELARLRAGVEPQVVLEALHNLRRLYLAKAP